MASRFTQLVLATLFLLTACAEPNKSTFSCAVPAAKATRQIYKGSSVTSYDVTPAKRLFISTNGTTGSLCTGTALSARIILTAAHCFYGVKNASAIQIEDNRPSGRSTFGAEKFVVHPESFKPPANMSNEEISKTAIDPGVDLAIVITNADIPAPYAKVADIGTKTGEVLNILGYGDTNEGGALPNQLQMAPAYFSEFYDTKTSAGYVPKSVIETKPSSSGAIACQGDSGGPLVIASQGFQALIGVTSGVNVYGCGKATRVDFVRIVSFASWINQTAGTYLTAFKADGC